MNLNTDKIVRIGLGEYVSLERATAPKSANGRAQGVAAA